MRYLLFLLPVALLAQTTTSSPKSSSTRPTTEKSAIGKPMAPKPGTLPALTTDEEKTIYAIGLSISRSLSQFDLSPAELAIVQRAIADGAARKPAEDLNTWMPKIPVLAQQRAAAVAAHQQELSNAYLAKAAAEPGAVKTESGLIYRELSPGTGPSPTASDMVKVNYRGTLVDGTEFDSSYIHNQPAQFPLSGVIPCWTEGLQKMKVGEKAQLVCPANIAYGAQGRPGIPGNATLIFEIELLDIPAASAAPSAAGAPHDK